MRWCIIKQSNQGLCLIEVGDGRGRENPRNIFLTAPQSREGASGLLVVSLWKVKQWVCGPDCSSNWWLGIQNDVLRLRGYQLGDCLGLFSYCWDKILHLKKEKVYSNSQFWVRPSWQRNRGRVRNLKQLVPLYPQSEGTRGSLHDTCCSAPISTLIQPSIPFGECCPQWMGLPTSVNNQDYPNTHWNILRNPSPNDSNFGQVYS